MTARGWLKNKGLKNPPIDSGISGGGNNPRIYVSDVMDSWLQFQAKYMFTREEMKIGQFDTEYRYPLFKHMEEEHGLTLLESELDEIIRIVKSLGK